VWATARLLLLKPARQQPASSLCFQSPAHPVRGWQFVCPSLTQGRGGEERGKEGLTGEGHGRSRDHSRYSHFRGQDLRKHLSTGEELSQGGQVGVHTCPGRQGVPRAGCSRGQRETLRRPAGAPAAGAEEKRCAGPVPSLVYVVNVFHVHLALFMNLFM